MTIKYYSLVEQVYHKLLEYIMDGVYTEGEKLSEETICAEFGVSRTPAREALVMLHNDGLVERFPRRGCFVKRFDVDDLRDLYQCRKILECMALEMGFDNIPRHELELLEETVEGSLSLEKPRSLDTDERMHEIIVSVCPNKHLREMIRHTVARTRPFRSWRTYSSSDIKRISEERRGIIRAILDNDRALAVKLLGEHILQGEHIFEEKNSASANDEGVAAR
ncbi:MAG: GntR family transcriptional regulator [Victivallales bacterium]|nr:GntR family transcriptional regulator [Victivallales bacterium]